MQNKELYRLGQNMKSLRLAHKMSLRQLSAKMNIAFSTVNSWELANKQPRIEQLERFCEVFNVRIEDLWK